MHILQVDYVTKPSIVGDMCNEFHFLRLIDNSDTFTAQEFMAAGFIVVLK